MHNTPKQSRTASAPFIDHIVDGTESPRNDDNEIVEIGEDSYDTSVKFVEKENERKSDKCLFQYLSLSYTIQIVLRGTDVFVAFSRSDHSSTFLTNGTKFRRVISFQELIRKS